MYNSNRIILANRIGINLHHLLTQYTQIARSTEKLSTNFAAYHIRHQSSLKMSRGAFIVLEGCDRSGKSTQARLLVENLEKLGHSVKLFTFPDRTTTVGGLCSGYLKNEQNLEDHVIHLLFTANRWESKDTMINLLNSGTTIIADRYSYSGVAYSASKKSMNFKWCRTAEAGLPAPDEVIFLELSPEVAATRGQFGEERYENVATQARVRKVYEQLIDGTWALVDADKKLEVLNLELVQRAEATISKTKDQPIKLLWEELL